MSNPNQKGTALSGEGIDEEVIASSDSIFTKGSYGVGQKGLQQFFTPEQVAKLAAKVMGPYINVLDPTAGDGSFLCKFDPPNSYGVEIDKDQINAATGSYNAVKGDLQHVYPLLKLTFPSWDGIVCNPPFGLQWEDPAVNDGRPINSSVMSFIYCSRLLSEDGQLIFITGKDRFYRQIADLPEAEGIYAVVECDNLFEGTTLPSVIAFGIHPGNRSAESTGYIKREGIPLDMLDLLGDWVLEARREALGRYNSVATRTYGYSRPDEWKALQKEYDRRVEKRLGKAKREFDAQLVGGKGGVVQWLPSAFATLALREKGDHYAFDGLNKQSVNYFVNNERLWNKLVAYAEEGILTVDPRLVAEVDEILDEIRKVICPLYEIKPQQRLGYLTDVDFLRCTASDPDRGFVAGESYRLRTRTVTEVTEENRPVESKKNPGEIDIKTFLTQRKVMEVTVGHWNFTDSGDDASNNIDYLIKHFHLPDPGEVATRHPKEIAAMENLAFEILNGMFLPNSQKWEKKNPQATPYSHRQFQKRDVARLMFKQGGMLSWEQGLGKTLGGALFAEGAVRLGAQDARLFITAKDLIPQWQRELERFYGKKATLIKTHAQAQKIAKELRRGGTGLYITYYEALSIVGTRQNKKLPVVVVDEREEQKQVKGTDRYNYFYFEGATAEDPGRMDADGNERKQILCKGHFDPEVPKGAQVHYGYVRAQFQTIIKQITSKEICPECRADVRNGWNGTYCEAELDNGSKCGYAHYAVKIRPIASYLSRAFKHGVIVMDEITMIQGDDSKRSKALRGLQAKWKLGMTGTPIKNFVAQAYWLLWWCLGDGSKRFGYTYEGGRTKFENDFSVVEWVKNNGKRENRKALPEVTNLSMLWRLLASSIIRRRKEETGEKLVPKFYHEIEVPLGVAQTEQMDEWMKKLPNGFPAFFQEKYPDKKVVKAGMHDILAPLLGLNWKLDYACTLPVADPDAEWPGTDNLSNWTPANLRVVELAMALAKEGRKVLIGSNLVATSKWIAERLCEKGVKAEHIVDESGVTASAEKRAQRVYSFQTDDVEVFCAGVNAIRLGHNLDAANAVIMHGLDWSFDTNDQFINRVHRLTSKSAIDVYIVLPKPDRFQTITSRKWDTLGMKEDAAALALDGRLIEKHEEQIDKNAIINQLREAGISVDDDTVDEVTIEEAWDRLPMIDAYEIPEGLIPPQPELPEEFEWTPEDCLAAAELHADLFPATTNALPIQATITESEAVEAVAVFLAALAPVAEDTVPDELVLAQNKAELDDQLPQVEAEDAGGASVPASDTDDTATSSEASTVEPGDAAPLAPVGADPALAEMAAQMKAMQEQMAALMAKTAEQEAEIERLKSDEQLAMEV